MGKRNSIDVIPMVLEQFCWKCEKPLFDWTNPSPPKNLIIPHPQSQKPPPPIPKKLKPLTPQNNKYSKLNTKAKLNTKY